MDYDTRFLTPQADDTNLTSLVNRGNTALTMTSSRTQANIKYRTAVADAGGNPVMRVVTDDSLMSVADYNPTTYGYTNKSTFVVGCKDTKGDSTNRMVFRWFASSLNTLTLWAQFNDNKMYVDHGDDIGSGRISAAVATSATPVVISGLITGSSTQVRRNGAQVLSGSTGGFVSSASAPFCLAGADNLGSPNLNWQALGDYYAFIHAPIASDPIRRRMEQSVAYSFKIPVG
jgi:hypothetical protein